MGQSAVSRSWVNIKVTKYMHVGGLPVTERQFCL